MKKKIALFLIFASLMSISTGCLQENPEEKIYLLVRADEFSKEANEEAERMQEEILSYLVPKIKQKTEKDAKKILAQEVEKLQASMQNVYIKEVFVTEKGSTVFVKIGKGEGKENWSVLYPVEENEYKSVFYEFFTRGEQ